MFSDKLEFIMNLTNTPASSLGKACHLSAAYVSRLKVGTRPLPKKPEFLPGMCACLAKRMSGDYQKDVIARAMGLPAWPADEDHAARLLLQWLTDDGKASPNISPMLDSFAAPFPQKTAPAQPMPLSRRKPYYYGDNGKQEAVLQFFKMILRSKKPHTLLLYSEEDMGWLYEDPQFAAAWANAFANVLKAGNRVRIIHTIGRSINEMLEGVAKWIPMYMTGTIEPFYYPKLRDGIFKRSLFLAPGTAAIVSGSILGNTDGMLNELITDQDAVAALTKEYEQLLMLCRPLMQTIRLSDSSLIAKAFEDLVLADGAAICINKLPSLSILPEQVAAIISGSALDGPADIPENLCIFAKEGCGVIVLKGDAPGVAFAFSESSMVSAFWDYLSRKL